LKLKKEVRKIPQTVRKETASNKGYGPLVGQVKTGVFGELGRKEKIARNATTQTT